MINIENFLNSISNKIPTGFTFSPSDTDLDNYIQKKIQIGLNTFDRPLKPELDKCM